MHTDEQRQRLGWWLTLSRSVGWWEPYEGICFVCERPARQAVDDQGRLHHESAPALLCRDGFGVYAWHGTRVPAHVIESPELLTADQITKEPNAEVRRVMLARYGADRYVRSLGVSPLDTDAGEELYRVPRDGDSDLCLVRVINGSPEPFGTDPQGDHVVRGSRWYKRYWLRVNPEHATSVRDAVASTYQVPANEYHPVLRT